jgi:hypothetical protein
MKREKGKKESEIRINHCLHAEGSPGANSLLTRTYLF